MSIISIIVVLLIVGFIVYLFRSAPIPIDPFFKTAIIGIVCIAVLIWLLQVLGFHTGFNLRLR